MLSFSLLAQAAAPPLQPNAMQHLDSGYRWWGLLLAIVITIVVSKQLTKWLRMPTYFWKLSLVLCSMVVGVVGTVLFWPPKLGIDLSGGVILVYEIEQAKIDLDEIQDRLDAKLAKDEVTGYTINQNKAENQLILDAPKADADQLKKIAESARALSLDKFTLETDVSAARHLITLDVKRKASTDVDMKELIKAVSKRVNPTGTNEITLRAYGKNQIEIINPNVDPAELEQMKKIISTAGVLEFRILANENDHPDTIAAAKDPKLHGNEVKMTVDGKEKLVGLWVDLGPGVKSYMDHIWRDHGKDANGNPIHQILVVMDDDNVTGDMLSNAAAGRSNSAEHIGAPNVQFSFNSEGSKLFGDLTLHNVVVKDNQGKVIYNRFLGVLMDKKLMSAATIQSVITSNGEISGDFTQAEVDAIVSVLNAGKLPSTLNPTPISQQQISAQLGEDSVKKGAWAMLFSVAAVIAFMLIYYRLSGFIACWAMLVNLSLTVFLMIIISAAFTLPGLAGLVLGVAMCVDANVLIYERIREERERGAGLRMAIRNGFHRSTATIVDSHVATLITAVILYWIGTEQIRGFAVTLIIGLLLNIYTALFCSHVIFDIGEKRKWFEELRMHHVFGHTKINFMALQKYCIPVSVVLIAAGIFGVYLRGTSLFDIDFTGGSSIQIVLKNDQAMKRDVVVAKIENEGKAHPDDALANLLVSTVQIEGQPEDTRFKIDTAEKDVDKVREVLADAFGGQLQTYEMDVKDLKQIAAEPTKTEPSKPEAAKTAPAKSEPAKSEPAKTEPSKTEPPKTEPTGSEKDKTPAKPAEKQSRALTPAARLAMQLAGPLDLLAEEPATEKADEKKADDKTADDKKPADLPPAATPSTDEKKAEDKKPDETKPDETKPDETKPDEKKPAEKKPAASDLEPRPEPNKTATSPAAPEPAAPAPSSSGGADLEFVGGTEATLNFPNRINYPVLKGVLDKAIADAKLEPKPDYRISNPEFQAGSEVAYENWQVKITLPPAQAEPLLHALKADFVKKPIFLSANNIGGAVAGDTQRDALRAVLVSMFFIVVYIWIRFQNVVFGLGAVVALVHDVIIPVGFIAWSAYVATWLGWLRIDPFQISLPVMAAILTLMGYSLNDTIVVFDRIREVRGKSPNITAETVNVSINQTLSRTVLTSFTVFMVVLILYWAGGQGIHAFAFAMLIGVVVGTYSSIYIAAPILVKLFRPYVRPGMRRATAVEEHRVSGPRR